jgi:hypothetical protein
MVDTSITPVVIKLCKKSGRDAFFAKCIKYLYQPALPPGKIIIILFMGYILKIIVIKTFIFRKKLKLF